MSLAACIIRWPCTTRSPWLVVAALGQVILQHRRCDASLTCRNSGSCSIATLHQHDERPGADAADTHDLAGDIDDVESFEQVTAIVLQGRAIRAELLVDHVLPDLDRRTRPSLVANSRSRDDDRRLADDPVLAVDELAELRQRLHAVACVGLLRVPFLGPSSRRSSPSSSPSSSSWLPCRELGHAEVSIAISSSSDRCAYQMSIVRHLRRNRPSPSR